MNFLSLKYFFCLSPLAFCLFSCTYLPDKQDVPDVVSIFEYRTYIEINPSSNHYSKTGFVFYPAGLIDPHAYIEPLSSFAKSGKGHKVVIVKMPGNLAVMDPNQGAWIYDHFPDVEQWVIGGHSLGGVMACATIQKYPDFFKGLVLMASYPETNTNLSQWEGSVLSLRGQFDDLVDSLQVASHQGLLPTPFWISSPENYPPGDSPKTVYYTIPGGNHAQFGKYGPQEGDGAPGISLVEQYETVSQMMLKFFIINGLEYDK
jgi:hypothetical protein